VGPIEGTLQKLKHSLFNRRVTVAIVVGAGSSDLGSPRGQFSLSNHNRTVCRAAFYHTMFLKTRDIGRSLKPAKSCYNGASVPPSRTRKRGLEFSAAWTS